MATTRLQIQQTILDALSWTPILAPIAGNGFTIQDVDGLVAIKLRSDPTDMTTEFVVPVGMQGRVVTGPLAGNNSVGGVGNFRFGDVVVYAQSDSGTITSVSTFL